MMVSDFVTLVRNLLNVDATTMILCIIAFIITGAITHNIFRGIRSRPTLAVGSLIILLFWIQVWESGSTMPILLATISLAVVGYELYIRLLDA